MFSYPLLPNPIAHTSFFFLDLFYDSATSRMLIYLMIYLRCNYGPRFMEHQFLKIIRNTLLCGLYIKMPRINREQYTDTNIEMHIKTFWELRPDFKVCWFAIFQPGLQQTCWSKFFLMLLPEKNF